MSKKPSVMDMLQEALAATGYHTNKPHTQFAMNAGDLIRLGIELERGRLVVDGERWSGASYCGIPIVAMEGAVGVHVVDTTTGSHFSANPVSGFNS